MGKIDESESLLTFEGSTVTDKAAHGEPTTNATLFELPMDVDPV
jgi:hypothetical protein